MKWYETSSGLDMCVSPLAAIGTKQSIRANYLEDQAPQQMAFHGAHWLHV